jgi:hypothetical protein
MWKNNIQMDIQERVCEDHGRRQAGEVIVLFINLLFYPECSTAISNIIVKRL